MKHIFIFSLLICFSINITKSYAAAPQSNTKLPSDLKIMTTIKPIHSLVSLVTEGVTTPSLLIDTAISIHDYILKPSDASKLKDSEVIFYINDHLESFVKDLKGVTLIRLADQVDLLPARTQHIFQGDVYSTNKKDLHIWLSPSNAKKIIQYVKVTLSNMDEKNKMVYETNAANAVKRIDELTLKITKELASVKDYPYVVAHDAYQYFEKQFGLHPLATLSLEDEITISVKTLGKIKKMIRTDKIKCVFSTYDNIQLKRTLNDEIKQQVLDPIGLNINPGKDLYLTMMENLAHDFKKCFS